MKRELKLFKSWYEHFTIKHLIPSFKFSKNVQGWFFTRNYSITLFRYCLNYSITITSDVKDDRCLAHERNVAVYMRS